MSDHMIQTLDSIEEVVRLYRESHQKPAVSYNIFRVLEVAEREVMICRVLADLLNPSGTHGNGEKYLESFLSHVLGMKHVTGDILKETHVYKEYPISGERRIDIVIRSSHFFIPIEVKIHASDQPCQCFDYYQYAAREYPDAKVVYLTKTGYMPSDKSMCSSLHTDRLPEDKILCISFCTDIRLWLENILEDETGVMKYILSQYLEVIKDYTNMPDENLLKEISERMLEKEEYFRTGLQIASSANMAKGRLIYKVFEEFEKQMKPLLGTYHLEKEENFSWYIYEKEASERFYTVREGTTYPGINYVVKDAVLPDDIQLWFRIEVDHNLFAGFCLFDPHKKGELGTGDQQDEIDDALKAEVRKYLNVDSIENDFWWCLWRYLPTGTDHLSVDRDRVPDFKEMNEAAVRLADEKVRKEFVRESIGVAEACLLRLLVFRKWDGKTETLFRGWQETIIWSCLQGVMGEIYVSEEKNPRSAIAVLGDFCFLAGKPDCEMFKKLPEYKKQDFIILVPQDETWAELIESYYGRRAKQVTRYAFKKDGDVFDRDRLLNLSRSLPEGYVLQMIDRELFELCKAENWSRDLVSQFSDYETYRILGIGVAVLKDGKLAAGSSSYTRYQDGIEIEIDTKEEHRRKGLASACGARLILECLERGLYPSWDAHNPASAALAEKLGYHFSHTYPAYEIFGLQDKKGKSKTL